MSCIFETMDDHKAKFGLQDSLEIAEFTLSYIQRTEQQLSESLLNRDRVTAAAQAHKAISSVRLYGTPKLETLLVKIRDDDYATELATKLQHELSAELRLISTALSNWSAKHT